MPLTLRNPVYRRESPVERAELERIGISADSEFGLFFARHHGPFGSTVTQFLLLDLLDQDPTDSVMTATSVIRERFGWPDRYFVISDMLAHAVLVYDTTSDRAFNVDFDTDNDLLIINDAITPAVGQRAVHLIAMLRAEADQHHLAGAVLHRHRRGLLRDDLLAEKPAALPDVALDVGRDDLDVLAGVGGRHLVHLAARHEQREPLGRHAVGGQTGIVDSSLWYFLSCLPAAFALGLRAT